MAADASAGPDWPELGERQLPASPAALAELVVDLRRQLDDAHAVIAAQSELIARLQVARR